MVLEKTPESLLDSKEIKPVDFLKEINPEYSLEGLTLKLKLQYLGQLLWKDDSLEKTAWKNCRQEEKGAAGYGMVEWYHWLNGHEFE